MSTLAPLRDDRTADCGIDPRLIAERDEDSLGFQWEGVDSIAHRARETCRPLRILDETTHHVSQCAAHDCRVASNDGDHRVRSLRQETSRMANERLATKRGDQLLRSE